HVVDAAREDAAVVHGHADLGAKLRVGIVGHVRMREGGGPGQQRLDARVEMRVTLEIRNTHHAVEQGAGDHVLHAELGLERRLWGMISNFAASSARMPSCWRSASIMAIAGWVLPQQGNCLRPMVLPVTSSGSAQWSKILSAS